jgi:type I restriction enzyme, S subunit
MPRVSWNDMARYNITISSLKVAEKFSEVTNPMIQRIHSNIFESQTLAALRDTLLPKLLSGELRVGQAEKEVGAML